MTLTDHQRVAPAPRAADPRAETAPAPSPFEQCDRCQSPVDDQQRYCVVCGSHQRRPNDPVARYFAAARRPKTAAPATPSSQQRTVPTAVAAALIALLPIAAGIGILVGRGSADSSDAVIEALKAARATQGVAVATGAAGTAADGTATTADASASKDADASKDDGPKIDGIETSTKQAPILATGPTGSARKLEGSKPTAKDIAESKRAVEQINARKGKDYIDQQRDLPDTIVIP